MHQAIIYSIADIINPEKTQKETVSHMLNKIISIFRNTF